MADGVTFEMDTTEVIAALTALGDVAQPFINAAAQATADAIVREAKSRLQRQLGPNATGATVEGITSRPAYNNDGFIVIAEREPFPNLPFWLEKGTKKGKPRSHTSAAKPFFYASVLLEEGAHYARIVDAVQQAIDAQGLGS